MSQYSLALPGRRQQLTEPSPLALQSAMARENALTARMASEGANQMIGYRFNAQQDRMNEGRQYSLALEQHNDTLGQLRTEDRENALADQERRQQHALRTSVINNPAGASASSDEAIRALLRPETIAQFDEIRRSQVERNDRTNTGGGGAQTRGALTAAQTLMERSRARSAYIASERNVNAHFNNELRALGPRPTLNRQIPEWERQVAALQEQRKQALAEERAAYSANLAELPNLGPDGRVVMPTPRAAAPAGAGTQEPERTTTTPPPQGAGSDDAQTTPQTQSTGSNRANPVAVSTPAEAAALSAGTWYRTPDGSVRQRGGG